MTARSDVRRPNAIYSVLARWRLLPSLLGNVIITYNHSLIVVIFLERDAVSDYIMLIETETSDNLT